MNFRPVPEVGAQAQLNRDRAAMEATEARLQAERDRYAAECEARRQERAAKVAAWQAQDEAERVEREQKREADRLARVQTDAVTLKASMREAFLRQPGTTPAAFEKLWPQMLEAHQIEQTLAVPVDLTELTLRELRARKSFANVEAGPNRLARDVVVIEG